MPEEIFLLKTKYSLALKSVSWTNSLRRGVWTETFSGFLLWSAQEYLQSCQELMEEVLHFNVTEPPTSKVENGCSPSTPTDLQEIHFWQRHFRVCQKTFIVCACLPYVCKYCKIKDWNLLNNLFLRHFFFSTCALSAPTLFLRLFSTVERANY